MVCNSLLGMLTSTKGISLRFQGDKFGNVQIRTYFIKKSGGKVDEIIEKHYLPNGMPNVSFKFMPRQDIG